jgi:hypothetical protein
VTGHAHAQDDVKRIHARAKEEHARRVAELQRCALNPEDLDLIRQWYNAVTDLNPGYLGEDDRALAGRLWNG